MFYGQLLDCATKCDTWIFMRLAINYNKRTKRHMHTQTLCSKEVWWYGHHTHISMAQIPSYIASAGGGTTKTILGYLLIHVRRRRRSAITDHQQHVIVMFVPLIGDFVCAQWFTCAICPSRVHDICIYICMPPFLLETKPNLNDPKRIYGKLTSRA